MCSWNCKKLQIVDKEFWLYIKRKQDFSRSVSETSQTACLFIFNSWLVSFGVCIYMQYFFDVLRNKLQAMNIY